MKIKENIIVGDSFESAVTIPLFKNYFEYAIANLEEVGNLIQQDLIISFVIITTAIESYTKSIILKTYQSQPKLLTDDLDLNNVGISREFKDFVNLKMPGVIFSHFNQPYVLFKEFTICKKREFKDLLKWAYELKKNENFQYHSNLCDYYKLRSLFIHYWEFPLGAQKIDENGNTIELENEFEFKIESFNKSYFIDFLDKVYLFMEYLSESDTDLIKNKIKNIISKLKAL